MTGVQVEFGADVSALKAGAQQAATEVKSFSEKVKEAGSWSFSGLDGIGSAMRGVGESMKGLGESISARFNEAAFAMTRVPIAAAGIAAALGGGALFKAGISEANKLAGEAGRLSRALDITTDEASVLNTALGDIYSDSDTYIGAFQKFAQQLRTNEDGIKELGVRTRDTNGNLRDSNDLFREALAKVNEYKPGLDQTIVSQTMFGRSVDDVMKLQKLNNDVLDQAREKNEALGLTITKENVAASKAFKAAMNDVGDVLRALGKSIGNAVMPVFTRLGEWFSEVGPFAVGTFRIAINTLATGLEIVTGMALGAFRVLQGVAAPILEVGKALNKLSFGDVKGATEGMMGAFDGWGGKIQEGWKKAGEELKRTATEVQGIWSKGTKADAKPPGGGKSAPAPKREAGAPDQAATPKTLMPYYEMALAAEKDLASERDAIHGMSKEQELKFWTDLQKYATLTEKDKVAVAKKASEAHIALLREQQTNGLQLEKIGIDAARDAALVKVDLAEQAAQELVNTGDLTNDQLLEQQQQFEDKRYTIRLAALQQQAALIDPDRDPVQLAQTMAQIEQLEEQHQLKLAQIRGEVAKRSAEEQGTIWADMKSRMSSLWDQGVNAMMNGTLRWSNAFRAIGMQIGAWFGSTVVPKMVQSWAKGEGAKTIATAQGTATRLATEAWAAIKSVAIWAATAAKNIATSAWQAMAGAWAAISSIPIVGPVLAPVAAGAAFAGVIALAKNVSASAEGGYDIPAGVNPIVQTHAREMILPAKHADVIRAMADGGGGAGGGGDTFINHFHAADGQSVKRMLMDNQAGLASALVAARRNGHLTGKV